jgi:NAD(P)-dependent dehydrogenase (short-subunit alcohol dehydrogenase family)
MRPDQEPIIAGTIIPAEQKVVVITGASQGIGAGLVQEFRKIGYSVVANSRSIRKSDLASDPAILVVDGDIAAAPTAERIVSGAIERFGYRLHQTNFSRFRRTFHSFDPVGFAIFAIAARQRRAFRARHAAMPLAATVHELN